VVAGFTRSWIISLPVGILLTIGFIYVMKKRGSMPQESFAE
jgi:hypothetical protein